MSKIIALWTHPRSVSSAMERIMLERGDLTIFHEPFMYLYYVHDKKRQMPHFEVAPTHPTSYADIKATLLQAAEQRPVFFKDMCYYIHTQGVQG